MKHIKKEPRRVPGMMQMFRRRMAITVACGLAVILAAAALALGYQARDAARQLLGDHLSYVISQIRVKNTAADNLKIQTERSLCEKAYSVQQILLREPEILENEERLGEVCRGLDLAQLDVSDQTGTIIATWPAKDNYVGVMNYGNFSVTQKYLLLIRCPNLHIFEQPRQNAGLAASRDSYTQYAGVARLDEPGIIQVGEPGQAYDEALQTDSVQSIAPGYVIQQGGFILITSHSRVVSADDAALVGKSASALAFLPHGVSVEPSRVSYQGKAYLAAARSYQEYTIYAFLPETEVYANLRVAMLTLCGGALIVLTAVSVVLSRLVQKNVMSGIRDLNTYVSRVADGDLSALSDIRTTAEISALTDHVNLMVLALRSAFAEKDRRITSALAENERVSSEREAYRAKALHEPLTGLLNRAGFEDAGSELLAAALREGRVSAMLMLDHDFFKTVNDTCGHAAGDKLLVRTADALRAVLGGEAVIGRLGGDEFCAFVPQPPDEAAVRRQADALLARLSAPFTAQGHTVPSSYSIGIAFAPRDGTSFRALYKSADRALYRAKADGRACWREAQAGGTAAPPQA